MSSIKNDVADTAEQVTAEQVTAEQVTAEQVTARANEILLKLLDSFEREMPRLMRDSISLRAFETLCRAEAMRRGS